MAEAPTSDRPAAASSAAGGRPPWGPTNPLTAYCCAERAAEAVDAAQTASRAGAGTEHERLLQVAVEWRQLATVLATNLGMNRPRDPDRDGDRSRR